MNEKASESTAPCEASKPRYTGLLPEIEQLRADKAALEARMSQLEQFENLAYTLDAMTGAPLNAEATPEAQMCEVIADRVAALTREREALSERLQIDGVWYPVHPKVHEAWFTFVKLHCEAEALRTALRSARPHLSNFSEAARIIDAALKDTPPCPECKDTGTIEGGNYDFYCKCPAGAALEAAGTQSDERKFCPECGGLDGTHVQRNCQGVHVTKESVRTKS